MVPRENKSNTYSKFLQFKTFVCLSETIKMLKSHIYLSNCHIYVLITVYLAKLQYIYPTAKMFMPKISIYISKCRVPYSFYVKSFDIYIYIKCKT